MTRKRSGLYVCLAWLAVALYFAYSRSIWGDEMVRLDQQRMGLVHGLRALLSEPSPFSPGETILIWLSGTVLGPVLPVEIWGRLPSLMWGFGAMLVAASIDLKYLQWLLFFSVSLLSFATEMRTYGSLIFAGALACKLLWDQKKPLPRVLGAATWFTLAFTHIYGICFIGLACAFRRLWLQTAFAVGYVVLILSHFQMPHRTSGGAAQSVLEILKQSLGTLGNPHKATFLLAPLFVFGFSKLARRNWRLALELLVLLLAAVLGPVAATLRSHFPFLPRQILGGLFPYLLFCALGLHAIAEGLKRKPRALVIGVPVTLFVMAGAVPWVLCVLLKLPPFPNQPMHHFREVAQQIVRDGRKSVFLVDPCNEVPVTEYLVKAKGAAASAEPQTLFTFQGVALSKRCWPDGLCLVTLRNMDYCSLGSERFGPGTEVDRVIQGFKPPFDLLIHSLPAFSRSDVETLRTW